MMPSPPLRPAQPAPPLIPQPPPIYFLLFFISFFFASLVPRITATVPSRQQGEFAATRRREERTKTPPQKKLAIGCTGPAFISDLLCVIPNAHYCKRGTYDLKKIVEYAKI
ncbi:hypothetical protein Pfo_015751, partial [Paulownia fortunei]